MELDFPAAAPRGALLALFAALLAAGAEAAGRRGFRTGPEPDWVSPLPVELAAEARSEEVSGGLYYLLGDHQVRLRGGAVESYGHYAKRIVNEAGLETTSQLSLEFEPGYQTLELHYVRIRRGERVLDRLKPSQVQIIQREPGLELQLYDGSLSALLFLEDLRVGDVVEYAYTRRGMNPVFEGRYLGHFDAEWSTPAHRMRLRLLWPRGRSLFVKNHRTEIAPSVKPTPEGTEYVWEVLDPKPVPGDDEVPAWFETWGFVQISEFETWAEVAEWGSRLFAAGPRLPAELQDRIEAWRGSGDEAARVLAALRFVQDEVRYLGIEMGEGSHRPTPPDVVYGRRFGDCKDKALLFSAILREMGVAAHPALVHTSLGRGLDDWHPSPWAFNHVVTQVELGGRTYWVDPTRAGQGGGLGSIAFPDYERALVLRPQAAGLTAIPVEKKTRPTQTVRESYVVKDYQSPVEYRVETRYEGAEADNMRLDAQRRRREEVSRSYLNYYSRHHSSIRALGPLEIEDDRAQNLLVTRESYLLPDFWSEGERPSEKEAQLYPLTLQDYVRKPASASRRMPLSLAHPVFVRHVSEVSLPDEWDVESDGTVLSFPEMRFTYRARYAPKKITLEYDYQSLADSVAAARFPSYLQDVERVRSQLGYRLQYRPEKAARHAPAGRVNWPIVAIASVFLPFVGLGAFAVYGYRPSRPVPVAVDGRLPGIGGWLVLPTLGVFASVPRVVWDIAQSWPAYAPAAWAERTAPGAALYHPLWAPVLLLELLANIVLLVGAVLLCALLAGRRRTFPAAFIGFALLRTTVVFADSGLASLLPGMTAEAIRGGMRDALQSLVPLFLWVPYFLVSKRVRATFIR